MKRSQVRIGDKVFLNKLDSTSTYIGTNSDMRTMIGSYIEVYKLARHYNQCVVVRHPNSGESYTIHCNDISFDPILKNPRKIIKVTRKIQAKFDVETLTV